MHAKGEISSPPSDVVVNYLVEAARPGSGRNGGGPIMLGSWYIRGLCATSSRVGEAVGADSASSDDKPARIFRTSRHRFRIGVVCPESPGRVVLRRAYDHAVLSVTRSFFGICQRGAKLICVGDPLSKKVIGMSRRKHAYVIFAVHSLTREVQRTPQGGASSSEGVSPAGIPLPAGRDEPFSRKLREARQPLRPAGGAGFAESGRLPNAVISPGRSIYSRRCPC
jgi:hypothetical protein